MDGYPADYVGHNLPFVVLFGLGSVQSRPPLEAEKGYPSLLEKGIYISSELPNVTGHVADRLLSSFHEFDARDASWNNRPGKGKMGTMGFTYRTVGRALTLPPRKASAPSSLEVETSEYGRRASAAPVLHSPLSPLSPESPIYPDGILTSLWFSKHQQLLPSAIVSFFNFTMDLGSSTLQDNKLKTEINALRTSITSSSYKFRLLVVLVAEGEGSEMLTNERLGNIRRGTNMDPRSIFLLPHDQSPMEISAFVGTVLASLQPTCIDYYRELSKHARRKRNRGVIPPPTVAPTTGTSQTLSVHGWNVRYEMKLGYFAEFRQEMDQAGRNYEAAYEMLVDGEVFEGISSWSPRFNEARMLADVLAVRILRCLLWTGQTTSAAQSWANHRYRMLELVDRKGKGTGTYGWQAWEARWSSVMAELIERVDVPIFHVPEAPKANPTNPEAFEVPDIYAIPEKSFANEDRLPPWDLLHHEGYWYRRSAHRTRARRRLASTMPIEDRNEPGQSPASTIASRAHHYDTYLCPEPHLEYGLKDHFDHSALLIETLGKAAVHFSQRQQTRAVERAGFEVAGEFMKQGNWERAWTLLKPLWQNLSWRKTGWWNLVEEVSWAVRACARNLSDGETLVAVEWELHSNLLSPGTVRHDFAKCLDGLSIEEHPHAIADFESLAPCLCASFTFEMKGGHVGDPVPAQLTIFSRALADSAPIVLSEIELTFDGGLRGVIITHNEQTKPIAKSKDSSVELFDIAITDSIISTKPSSPTTPSTPLSTASSAELTFKPDSKKVFSLKLVPRDAGEVHAAQAVLSVREEAFFFDLGIKLREGPARMDWWMPDKGNLMRQKLDLEHPCTIEILPKPPKLQIELPAFKKTYYAKEKVNICVQLRNEEIDVADIRLHISLVGLDAPQLDWSSGPPGETDLEGRPMGQLAPGEVRQEVVSFLAVTEMVEYSLEVRADYTLEADPNTPISKSMKETLQIITPFEVSSEYLPRIHSEAWPSFFNIETIDFSEQAQGLKQKWAVTTRIGCFATDPLIITSFNLKNLDIKYGILNSLEDTAELPSTGLVIQPSETIERTFDLEVQKANLTDHHPSKLTFQLDITWHRPQDPFTATTSTAPPTAPPSTLPTPSNPLSPSSPSPADLPPTPSMTSPSPADLPPTPSMISPSPADLPDTPSLTSPPPPTIETTTTTLPIPPLSIPFSEPRLLLTSSSSASPGPTHQTLPLIHLTYHLENPSMHTLTFSLTMEASEDLAFSGPKAQTAQMTPLSRKQIRYTLLPLRSGVWIRPSLRVVDVGFGKVLRTLPGEGVRGVKDGTGQAEGGKGIVAGAGTGGAKGGVAVWVPVLEEDGED